MSLEEPIEKSPSSAECQEDLAVQLQTLDLKSEYLYFNTFTTMPLEILYQIFEICNLKEQLNLAKVCKLFRQIVRSICQQKFKFFNYNYLTFKYSLQLEDEEISELSFLCSKAVEKVRFSTYFNMDLLKNIEWSGVRTNPMENLKYFINDNFKQNVRYFKNLQELEVQGKFLQDHTVLELTKYCKHLRSIQLMDGDNRWFWGEHLQDLENIENLELKYCRNLDPTHLLRTSEQRNLKVLNIVECEHLKDIPKMLKLCEYWQNLTTLRLTAFTQDRGLLKSVINLPSLKILQFFWINFMPLGFEENFFAELNENEEKSLKLQSLKFENDRYFIEDESLQQWTDEKFAIMRENVCINGQNWQWSQEIFDKLALVFGNFKQLSSIYFQYCRLLNYDQLLLLSQLNQNLREIKIYGCPNSEDKLFKKQWLEQDFTKNCQLNFESFLTLQQVMNLYDEANSRQFSSYYRREPVLRSIECQFC